MTKIISYNVNSLNKRLYLVRDLIENYNPDILCFQEIKVSSEKDFPYKFFEDHGFSNIKISLSLKGQGGVAIASKIKFLDSENINFFNHENENGFQRHASVDLKLKNNYDKDIFFTLHNFYVPSGGSGSEEIDLTSEKFLAKLKFFQEMIYFFTENQSKKSLILGDLNIAPFENDVFNHKQLFNKVISHTKIEIDLFKELLSKGNFLDIGRYFIPKEEKLFSWWSHRSKNWKITNRGRRLDHMLIDNDLKYILEKFEILKDFREKDSPSDHCPLFLKIT